MIKIKKDRRSGRLIIRRKGLKNQIQFIKDCKEELAEIDEQRKELWAGEHGVCNGIGWDGDETNQYGRDCVLEEINELQNEDVEAIKRARKGLALDLTVKGIALTAILAVVIAL